MSRLLRLKAKPPRGVVPLGTLYISAKARRLLWAADVKDALRRYADCRWGDYYDDNWIENDRAREIGGRIESHYADRSFNGFWIITEPDRSKTTVLLAEEYQ